VSISLPPRPPDVEHRPPLEQDALIGEARRRARRRRLRSLVGILAALLGTLWLYSLLGGGGADSGSAFQSDSSSLDAAPLRALPEELSFNADGAIWLLRRDGSATRLVDHVYRTLDDGSLRSVRTIYGVEWSPDGSKLLAFRESASPALVLVDGRGRVGPKIASGASIGRWSPNGAHIAFVRRTPGAGYAIFVASNDGGSATRVAGFGQLQQGSFSWSPDSTRIVYAGRGDTGLFIADATGQDPPRPVRIATGGNLEPGIGVAEAQWSPDGSLIAFRGGGHVFVVRPDGTDLHRIADGYVYGLAWSPDSLSLAFAGAVGPATFGNVTVVGRDGTTHRRIAHCTCTLRGPGFSPSIAWSSDGSRLTYVGERGNVVGTVRANGLDATPVLAGNWDPSWPLWRPGHHA